MMDSIVKVPMSTYKGKPLDSYSKEQLIGIVEVVWQMYAITAEEASVAIRCMSQTKSIRRTTRILFVVAIGLAGLSVIISILRG